MDLMTPDILTQLGISGTPALIVYLIIWNSTKHRKEERNAELEILESKVEANKESLSKHLNFHREKEDSVCNKIDDVHKRINKVDDRLNLLSSQLHKIEGFLEAKKQYDKD